MPKKESSKKHKKKIKQIKGKIKALEKEDSLETEIEKTEQEIENLEFHESLQPTPTSAPVLKQVETFTKEPLESNISSSSITPSKEETGVNYTTKNEPKYAGAVATDNLDEKKYESEFKPPVLSQTESGGFRQEILTQQREAGMQESGNTSRIETNTLEQKRREPFGTQEKKYQKVNF